MSCFTVLSYPFLFTPYWYPNLKGRGSLQKTVLFCAVTVPLGFWLWVCSSQAPRMNTVSPFSGLMLPVTEFSGLH